MTEVSPGVWRAGSRWVNWHVVDGGQAGLTVIDAGLPGYRGRVASELASIGRTVDDIRAVLLTHGHVDHVGAASTLASGGARVFLHNDDVDLAADPKLNRTERSIVPYLRWPATLAFVVHAIAQGALRPQERFETATLPDGAQLEVPGRPVVTHAPGHTAGSCVFEFREHGVLIAGDLLCTASPITGARVRPQVQSRASNLDSGRALHSLERIRRVESKVILPGHGDPWRDGAEAAVAAARAQGCR